jgi:4-carboxymuconolactone decarboxylase
VHAHARRAVSAGATAEQIRHVVALAAPTVGFPTTVGAYTWVEEVLAKRRGKR